ncbi:MAG: flagellum-specific ATP synthase FliI, partial [Burkholderiaceae bacterium]
MSEPKSATEGWKAFLASCGGVLTQVEPVQSEGKLIRVAGLVMEAVGLRLPVGGACLIHQDGLPPAEAEV